MQPHKIGNILKPFAMHGMILNGWGSMQSINQSMSSKLKLSFANRVGRVCFELRPKRASGERSLILKNNNKCYYNEGMLPYV